MTLSDSRAGRCLAAPWRPLPSPRTGLPCLRATCLDVPCPLPRWTAPDAFVGCFPGSCCLPHTLAGSASMISFSRPAQASHMLRPVDSLDRPGRPLSQGFDPGGYPPEPPASYRANRPLPGWDFHPRGGRAVQGAPKTVESRRGAVARALRFPSPLIKPDGRISRIRLSDWLHDRLTISRPFAADGAASGDRDPRTPLSC